MFKLRYKKQFGGSLGGGTSSATNASRGTRTGNAAETSVAKQKGTQVNKSAGTSKKNTQQKGRTATSGSTATQGNQISTGATRTQGTTGARGTSRTASTGRNATKGTAQSTLQQTLSNLDAGTQEQLSSIISAVGSPEDAQLLQDAITSRALNADVDLAGNTEAILTAARRSGERKIGTQTTNLSKSAGSSQNSLVSQIGLEAQVDLETELAGLLNTLTTQNRQIATGELQGAAGQQVTAVSEIANILKGAQQTTAQTGTQQNVQTGTQQQVQDTANQSTQVVDQNVTTQAQVQTNTTQQTQQLVDSLQTAIESGSTTDIATIINDLVTQSNKQRSIDEAFQASGNTKGQKIGGGISVGFG